MKSVKSRPASPSNAASLDETQEPRKPVPEVIGSELAMDRLGFVLQNGGGVIPAADYAADPIALVDRTEHSLLQIGLLLKIKRDLRDVGQWIGHPDDYRLLDSDNERKDILIQQPPGLALHPFDGVFASSREGRRPE